MTPKDKPKNSLLVKGKKYRQLKENNATLTQKNCVLASDLIHARQKIQDLEKLGSSSNNLFEARIKALLNNLNHKDNEINELYANEIVWEIEKVLKEKNQAELETTNQNWQTSYQIARTKLNQITEREEELLQQRYEEFKTFTTQIDNLTSTLNYTKWERDNYQTKLSQLQEQVNQTQQRINQLETENNNLQTDLEDSEQRVNYRSQRKNRVPQWRGSEATLFGDDDENQAGPSSNNSKNYDNLLTELENCYNLIRNLGQKPSWKSRLWQKTKKLGLTALAAYGSYRTGYNHGSQSQISQNLTQFNHSLNPAQLYNHNYQPVSYNQTHSWMKNSVNNTHCDLNNPFHLTFQTSFFTPPPLHESNLLKELEQLRLRPNITQAEYKRLKNNQKPLNLPTNWESELARLKDLEARPTHDQLTQAINQEKDKYQDYIAPADLETKAQEKGLVSLETYNQRPNITLAKYNHLLNNQKPKELPSNWKDQLAQSSKNQNHLDTITNILPELINETGEFKENQASQILNELKLRPKPADLDQKVKETIAQTIAKYKDYIEPNNTTKIIEIAKAQGYQFQQSDLDEAIKTNNQTWTNKSLINPLNPAELEQAKLVPKTKLEQVIAERDNRPNINLLRYSELLNKEKTLSNRPNITLSEWENDWSQRPSNQSHADLDNKNHAYNTLNQTKLDLELDLLTKQTKIEQLNSLLNTLKDKYNQTRNEKTEALRTQQITQKERDIALAERDTALLNLETFNQQLDNTQQELIRTQRENRKLTQKLNQQQVQQTKTQQQNQEQSSYLQSVFQCLASAGIASKLAWKAGRAYEQKDLQVKYLKDIQSGINTLIQQKKAALQQLINQQVLNQTLQAQIDNHACPASDHTCPTLTPHTCSPCSLIHLPETHICPIQENCSHSEPQITQQINQELNLGLDNPSSEQIIIKLKELIDKPPKIVYQEEFKENHEKLDQAQQTITKLQKELNEKLTPFGEDLAVIKQLDLTSLEELYSLDSDTKQQIQQTTSYQQLVAVRQAFLQKQLTQKQTVSANLQTAQQEKTQLVKQRNLGLFAAGTVLTAGLVSTVILGRKVKELKRVNQSYYNDYKQLKDELSLLLSKMHGLMEKNG